MAEPLLLSDLKVWLGGTDLTGSLNRFELTAAKAELANARFGDTAEVVAHGLQQFRMTGGGFWSSDLTGEPDSVIPPRLTGTSTSWPLTITPPYAPTAAAGAVGNIAYTLVGHEFNYKTGGQHGQLLPYEFSSLPGSTYSLYRQRVEAARASVGVTTTSTGFLYGAITATQVMVATLHVFSINGGTWTLTIQSDDNADFTSATTRATFTAVTTAPNQQVVLISGAVTDTYWRAVMTETVAGTSLNYAVLLGIANA